MLKEAEAEAEADAKTGDLARRVRELENEKLKLLLADTMLDNVALKDLLTKKW